MEKSQIEVLLLFLHPDFSEDCTQAFQVREAPWGPQAHLETSSLGQARRAMASS